MKQKVHSLKRLTRLANSPHDKTGRENRQINKFKDEKGDITTNTNVSYT
jgi:hypothetical protein